MDDLIKKYEDKLKGATRQQGNAFDKKNIEKALFHTGQIDILKDILSDLKFKNEQK